MGSERTERRRFGRVLFSQDDGIVGEFLLPRVGGEPDLITANILNLGEGGLHFALEKGAAKGVSQGDLVTLKAIKGNEGLAFISDLEMEIRWVLDVQFLEHVGVGCEFQGPPETLKKQIRQFVDGKIGPASPSFT